MLTQLLGVHYVVATVIAVEAAILVNFVWHERWTWQDRGCASAEVRGALGRLLRFNALTALTSIAGSVIVTALLVEIVSMHRSSRTHQRDRARRLQFRRRRHASCSERPHSRGAGRWLRRARRPRKKRRCKPKTAADFAKYVAAVEARRAQDITNNEPFLDIERQPPAQLAKTIAALKRGEVIVTRGAARDASSNEIAIDGGLINHWRGTVFVPNVKLDAMLKVLQEPQTDKHKQEDVLSSRVVSRDGDSQKVFLRLRRTKFVTVVYDTEYDVDYRRSAPDRALQQQHLDQGRRDRERRYTARARAARGQRSRLHVAAQFLLALQAARRRRAGGDRVADAQPQPAGASSGR